MGWWWFLMFFSKNRCFLTYRGGGTSPPDPHSCCSWRWLACSLMSVRWLSDNVQEADSFCARQNFLLLCFMRDNNLHFYNLKGYISLVVSIADREENRNRQSILFFLLKVYLEDLLHFCNCSWCHITKLGYFDDAQTCFEFFDDLLVFLLQLLCCFGASFLPANLASLCSVVIITGFEAFLDGGSFVLSKLAEHSKEHREKSILAAIFVKHT